MNIIEETAISLLNAEELRRFKAKLEETEIPVFAMPVMLNWIEQIDLQIRYKTLTLMKAG